MAFSTIDASPRGTLSDKFKRIFGGVSADIAPTAKIKNRRSGMELLEAAEQCENARRAVDALLKRGF